MGFQDEEMIALLGSGRDGESYRKLDVEKFFDLLAADGIRPIRHPDLIRADIMATPGHSCTKLRTKVGMGTAVLRSKGMLVGPGLAVQSPVEDKAV